MAVPLVALTTDHLAVQRVAPRAVLKADYSVDLRVCQMVGCLVGQMVGHLVGLTADQTADQRVVLRVVLKVDCLDALKVDLMADPMAAYLVAP